MTVIVIAVAIIVLGSYLKKDYLVVREINVERPKQQIIVI
jgi:hypothetical protein